ncbi:MAG: RNA-binding domain-containing protein [Methanosarcinaceae archaeon]
MNLDEKVFWRYYNHRREDNAWDYKREILISNKSNFVEFAKDILAFTNYGGGYILLGVVDGTHELFGVNTEIDPSNLGAKIEKQLGFHIENQLFYFDHLENDQIIRLGIIKIPGGSKVLMSNRDLHNSKGDLIVQESIVYCRRNSSTKRASSDDIEQIIQRLSKGQSQNDVAIHNEPSALRSVRQDKFDFYRVLWGSFDPTSEVIGKKLKEVWNFKSEQSKIDFAQLIHISPDDIDEYFEGKKMPNISSLIAVTKMFNLPTDYFFRPTYEMRFAYWTEDLVKFTILSLVKPKSAISIIDNDSRFYAKVLHELTTGICKLHDLLYPSESIIKSDFYGNISSAWYLREPISDKLKSNLCNQYYKLLEQYPLNPDQSLVPQEQILRTWFFANDDYIARLIIEGIESIVVRSKHRFEVNLRFLKDLLSNKVRFCGYDSKNLKMRRRK